MQKVTIYKTNEIVGFHWAENHCDKTYVLFCDNHNTYMFGRTKKELKGLSTLEFCCDCKDAVSSNVTGRSYRVVGEW